MKIPELTWPDDTNEVECVGFSVALVYDLIFAINHDRVETISKGQNAWYHDWTFDFLGFRYTVEAEEVGGELVPYRIQKIARLGVDDDGNTIVDESFTNPTSMYPEPAPKYEGAWGSF